MNEEETNPIDELEAIIRDMDHTIANFSVIGPGVSGNIQQGWLVNPGAADESGTP
jgi:hypothetical protein